MVVGIVFSFESCCVVNVTPSSTFISAAVAVMASVPIFKFPSARCKASTLRSTSKVMDSAPSKALLIVFNGAVSPEALLNVAASTLAPFKLKTLASTLPCASCKTTLPVTSAVTTLLAALIPDVVISARFKSVVSAVTPLIVFSSATVLRTPSRVLISCNEAVSSPCSCPAWFN